MSGGKSQCGNTVIPQAAEGGGGTAKDWMDQLSIWARAARKQSDALMRAAAAAEVAHMIWDRLDEKQRERLSADTLLRERLRCVTGFYGYAST